VSTLGIIRPIALFIFYSKSRGIYFSNQCLNYLIQQQETNINLKILCRECILNVRDGKNRARPVSMHLSPYVKASPSIVGWEKFAAHVAHD